MSDKIDFIKIQDATPDDNIWNEISTGFFLVIYFVKTVTAYITCLLSFLC